MHMGDIAHNPVTSLQHPEWTPIFDYDPAGAITSRKAILGRVATDGIMAMGYHFPFPGIGHVVKHDKAYRWEAVHWAWSRRSVFPEKRDALQARTRQNCCP